VQSAPVAPRGEGEEQRRRLRFPSLIERMTGHARGRTEAPAQPQAQPPMQHHQPAPQHEAQHYAPQHQSAHHAAQPAAPQPQAERRAEPEAAQKQFGGLDPADRIAVSRQEEDLLDIPAFLRRQAN